MIAIRVDGCKRARRRKHVGYITRFLFCILFSVYYLSNNENNFLASLRKNSTTRRPTVIYDDRCKTNAHCIHLLLDDFPIYCNFCNAFENSSTHSRNVLFCKRFIQIHWNDQETNATMRVKKRQTLFAICNYFGRGLKMSNIFLQNFSY